MSRISTAMGLFNLALVALFVVSLVGLDDGAASHGGFTLLAGLLSLGMMAFALVLATRPRWMEPGIGGGIGGLLVPVFVEDLASWGNRSAVELVARALARWRTRSSNSARRFT